MDYFYLKKWIKNISIVGFTCKKVQNRSDQYRLYFFETKNYLHINLSVEDSFCFLGLKDEAGFKATTSKLANVLKGSKIENIELLDSDRIIFIHLKNRDIFNVLRRFILVLELVPRYANMVLIKAKKGNFEIVDSVRYFTSAQNPQREILPKGYYCFPKTSFVPKKKSSKLILKYKNKDYSSINDYMKAVYTFKQITLKREIALKRRITSIKRKIKKKKIKLSNLIKIKEKNKNYLDWKIKGELLRGSFSSIKAGRKSIVLINYFEEGFPKVEIDLQEELTAQKNIDFYFKKYRKAKRGKDKIEKEIKKTEQEISNLEKNIKNITFQDYEKSALKKTISEKKFRSLKIRESWEILIGRNAKESDFLTTKMSKPFDWWFHAKLIHGSHIIAKNLQKSELSSDIKKICCSLAAYYSKAKHSSNVPVDYTMIKYVRKPRKSKVGFVEYKHQKTLYVNPLSIREVKKTMI